MSFKRVILILCALSISSCSVLLRGSKQPLKPSDVGYSGDAEVTFYYTEALKENTLGGNPERASKLFMRALELDSLHHPSSFEMAKLLAATNPAQAQKFCMAAMRGDSTNTWYNALLGRIMIAGNKYSQALTLYSDLVKNGKPNVENYRILAALYEQNGQPFSAINILDSAENKFGRYDELSDFKRQLLIKLKLYDRALAEAQASVNESPYDEYAYIRLGDVYDIIKRDSLAESSFKDAVRINPTNPETIIALNEFYRDRGDNENFLATTKTLFQLDALSADNKVDFFHGMATNNDQYRAFFFQLSDLASTLVIKYPSNYRVVDLYATHMTKSGNINEALNIYKSFIDREKPNIDAYNNVLDIEAYLKHSDSVEVWAQRAITAFPQNSSLYIRKGSAQQYLGEHQGALQSFQQALRYAQSDSVSSSVLGIMGDMEFASGGKRGVNRAYAYYKKALKLDPRNAMVLNNYAYFMAESGRSLERALEMTKLSNSITPLSPTFLDTYAWVLYKQGKFAEAKKIMQQAISLDATKSSELSLHYGDILNAMGEQFMAHFYWRKALEQGAHANEVEKRFKTEEKK